MLDVIRLYVLTVLTQAGYVYAAWSVLRQGKHTVTETLTSGEDATAAAAAGGVVQRTESARRTSVCLDTACLKLCIMMTAMGAVVLLGADALPLFPECRVIAMYLVLFAPPSTQREVYDNAFSPLLVKCGNLARSVQSSDFLTKRVCLFLVRKFVSLSIVMMNYVDRCGTLEPDAIKDILGGLVFSRRALDDVAAQQRQKGEGSPTATFVQSLLSSLSNNDVGAALRDFAASATSVSSNDGLTATTDTTTAASVMTDSSDRAWQQASAFSAVEEVTGREHEKVRKRK